MPLVPVLLCCLYYARSFQMYPFQMYLVYENPCSFLQFLQQMFHVKHFQTDPEPGLLYGSPLHWYFSAALQKKLLLRCHLLYRYSAPVVARSPKPPALPCYPYVYQLQYP